MLLTGLLSALPSAAFLLPPRTTCPELALPPVDKALSHKSLMKKIAPQIGLQANLLTGIFSVEVCSSQMPLACVELIIKLSYKYTKNVEYVRMSRSHNRRKIESIQENSWWL